MGNYSFPGCELPDGFIPIGMKAYGDILYIISYNDNSKLSQIGTFPSPEYNGINGNIVYVYFSSGVADCFGSKRLPQLMYRKSSFRI